MDNNELNTDELLQIIGTNPDTDSQKPALQEQKGEKPFKKLIENYINLIKFLNEKIKQIPPWIPVLRPLLEGKMAEIESSIAFGLGIDLNNPDKKLGNWSQRMSLAGKKLGEALFGQVQALYEILSLVGTGGTAPSGEVVASAAKGFTSDKLMPLLKLIKDGKGATMLVDTLPEALNKLPSLLSKNPELVKTVEPFIKFISKLAQNETSKKALTDWVSQQPWLLELQAKLESGDETLESLQEKIRDANAQLEQNIPKK